MKIKSAICTVLFTGLLLPLLLNCKKEVVNTPPTIQTSLVTNIMETTATSGDEVIADGGDAVTASGVCWDKYSTLAGNTTTDGVGTGSGVKLWVNQMLQKVQPMLLLKLLK